VRTWGELGLSGAWSARPIHLYGFATENDKSRIFSDLVFHKGEGWNPEMESFSNLPGTKGTDAGQLVVDAVGRDAEGIGISNIHYATAEVKALSLRVGGGAAIAATRATVGERSYPLTRAVYMVVDMAPGKPARAVVMEFLRFVLSREGQKAVRAEGNYLPLTPAIAEREWGRLERRSGEGSGSSK
jgi:phosphate transport system substrate-binding protein